MFIALQAGAGSSSTNFVDISASIVIHGSGDVLTANHLDADIVTNWPTRFYGRAYDSRHSGHVVANSAASRCSGEDFACRVRGWKG